MAEQAVPLLRERCPWAPESALLKMYYDAGHELDDPPGKGPVECVKCGAQAIDLFEDAAYGPIRKCVVQTMADGGLPHVEFYQHDWIPAFAAFVPGATMPAPDARAFCVLNLQAFLGAVEADDIPAKELPYFIAESMMHEIVHALEQWASVEFSEERVEALLAKYRDESPTTKDQGDKR